MNQSTRQRRPTQRVTSFPGGCKLSAKLLGGNKRHLISSSPNLGFSSQQKKDQWGSTAFSSRTIYPKLNSVSRTRSGLPTHIRIGVFGAASTCSMIRMASNTLRRMLTAPAQLVHDILDRLCLIHNSFVMLHWARCGNVWYYHYHYISSDGLDDRHSSHSPAQDFNPSQVGSLSPQIWHHTF